MIGHMQCHNSRQNSSIISSIYSEDTMISSTFIRHIMVQVVADIEVGPDGSDVCVPRGKIVQNSFGWGISCAMVT